MSGNGIQGGYTAPAGSEKPKPPTTGSGVKTPTNSAPRTSGRIKWFDPKKGYGFIECPGADKDIFLHQNSLPEGIDTLVEGQVVTYQTENSKKGVRAINVEVGK